MRILIVEDESDLRSVLARTLREEGYAVDEAADGSEGMFKSDAWNYDGIILDWMLPEKSGIEILQAVRAKHSTPVLMLTARDHLEDRVYGLDAGADDYLVKPFQLEELLARLRALLRRSAGKPTPELVFGSLTINTAARVVQLADQPIELTAREYRLLELLCSKAGAVVSRSEIYDSLFDDQHDSMSNIVDVYISRLRSKIGKHRIRTRRGEGYVFDA